MRTRLERACNLPSQLSVSTFFFSYKFLLFISLFLLEFFLLCVDEFIQLWYLKYQFVFDLIYLTIGPNESQVSVLCYLYISLYHVAKEYY